MNVNAAWTGRGNPGTGPNVGEYLSARTVRETKVIRHDDCDITLTVVKPFMLSNKANPLSAFLFLQSQALSMESLSVQEKVVSELVTASGQAAVMVSNPTYSNSFLPVFEAFSALKWLGTYGQEMGIDGRKMAVVGTELGANAAAVLSLMAMSDNCPGLSLQILIDPRFYIAENHLSGRTFHRPGSYGPPACDTDWVNMKRIFNLPFDLKAHELAGHPPTLVQLSENAGNRCELEYYCTRLLNAGNDVTYTNYEDSVKTSIYSPYTSRSLLTHAAAELRKFAN